MADVSKMAEEWLSEHPDATKKEIWLAGYWKSTDNWCNRTIIRLEVKGEIESIKKQISEI